MRPIEFYSTPEGEVTLREAGKPERQLQETDYDFIQDMLSTIREYYPQAYDALMQQYSITLPNKSYRDFLAVRRFIKCNFGVYDNQIDVDGYGNFHFEFVPCPMRGECKFDKILCQPQFNSKLSDRQLEIMRLCYEGVSDADIAERLYISINTVANHRKASFRKLGIHSMAEFNRYAADNNLFNNK